MPWYRTGTVAVTNGNTAVTGTGTQWVANATGGHGIILPDGRIYEIASVNSNTSITLAVSYLGSTASGQNYTIVPTRGPELALLQQVTNMVNSYGAAFLGVGQGLFPGGTAAVPSARGAADTNTGINWLGSDQLEIVTNGVRRVLVTNEGAQITGLLSGTAVTQSATDNTTGRLLKVGDFGIGTARSISDFTAAIEPGLYFYSEAVAVGAPGTGASFWGHALIMKNSSGGNFAFAGRGATNTNSRLWFGYRATSTGAFTWIEVMHHQRLIGTVAQSAGVPTGAVFETGTNANGTYTRFADGTQICSRTLTGSTGAGSAWTFPAAFIAAPVVTGCAVATVLSAAQIDAAPSATAVTVSARDKTDARRADVMHLTATGRWF